jgi:hypothetical protein
MIEEGTVPRMYFHWEEVFIVLSAENLICAAFAWSMMMFFTPRGGTTFIVIFEVTKEYLNLGTLAVFS